MRPPNFRNELFNIAPTEALIIGCFFEEYLYVRKHEPYWPFLDVIRSRIEPFIPDLKQTTSVQISASDVPSDILWNGGEVDEYGVSAAYPNTLFVRNERGVFRQVVDASRHNLKWLLLFYLDTTVGMSPEFRRFVRDRREFSTDLNRVVLKYEKAVSSAGPQYNEAS